MITTSAGSQKTFIAVTDSALEAENRKIRNRAILYSVFVTFSAIVLVAYVSNSAEEKVRAELQNGARSCNIGAKH
ncbi:hypothetical protein [Paraburkholderia sediminicola]|uniref:hypothetical protein n=1 Tax=Paraburkholderia sediminicola TaxID=458836 RepID=UPI0038BD00BD